MLLALSIISSQAAALGATAYKVFDERGGTIGRVAGNDWILPNDSFVSSRHANVRWAAGAFYLEDTSSNGTFLNAPDKAVSRAAPARLQDGDRLFIGDFEIIVQLIDAAPASPPGVGLGTVDPLAALGAGLSQPRAAPPLPTMVAPSPPAAAAAPGAGHIPDNWEPTGFNRTPAAAQAAPSTPQPAQMLSSAPAAAPPPAVSAQPAAAAGTADLLMALGLDPARVDPAIQQQLGAVLRIAVQGLMDVLKSRAEVKNNFRLPITIIKPVENNPLMFSMNAEDALFNLFVKRNPGYLGPWKRSRKVSRTRRFIKRPCWPACAPHSTRCWRSFIPRIWRKSTNARRVVPRCSVWAAAASSGSCIASASRRSTATAKLISNCSSAKSLHAPTTSICRSSPRTRDCAGADHGDNAFPVTDWFFMARCFGHLEGQRPRA